MGSPEKQKQIKHTEGEKTPSRKDILQKAKKDREHIALNFDPIPPYPSLSEKQKEILWEAENVDMYHQQYLDLKFSFPPSTYRTAELLSQFEYDTLPKEQVKKYIMTRQEKYINGRDELFKKLIVFYLKSLPLPKEASSLPESINLFPEKMEICLKQANESLIENLAQKAEKLPSYFHTAFIPFDEGVRHYRLGEGYKTGWGLKDNEAGTESLQDRIQHFENIEFPNVVCEESQLLSISRIHSLREANPNIRIMLQHFPSGSALLEATEEDLVHFDNPTDIQRWQKNYSEFLETQMPDGIMLSHASYDYSEKSFPGITYIRNQTELSPFLKNVDFNSIPASLNPVVSQYLREQMNYEGLIIADWYDMGAIKKFAESVDMDKLNEFDWRIKAFVLATDAGVDTLQGFIDLETLIFKIEQIKEVDPPLFERINTNLDRIIENSFIRLSFLKNQNDPNTLKLPFSEYQKLARPFFSHSVSTKDLSFTEKYLFVTFNSRHYQKFYNNFEKAFEVLQKKGVQKKHKFLFELLYREGVGDFDIWNRFGVMTMMQRQLFVEELAGKSFLPLPASTKEESAWFETLMNHKEFRFYYDQIQWDSSQMKALFQKKKQELLHKEN